MTTFRKWSLENLKIEASKYDSLKDFRSKSEGAYKAYLKHGKPKEILESLSVCRTYWTEETALEEANLYESRWDFQNGSGGAYRFLWKRGLLEKAFDPLELNTWCEDSVRQAAKEFYDRKSFKSKLGGAFKFAYNNDMLDELFGGTLNTPKCDNDVLYLWRPKGYKNVYKVGITSKRLGDERIRHVANKGGLEVSEVIFIETDDAKALEAKILSGSEAYGFYPKFSGSTEFRIIKNISDYFGIQSHDHME